MPPLAGERWCRKAPKGGISNARRAVVWFYTNWRLLSIHRRPTTTLAPKGETTHYDLCVALLLQIMFAVHARGASNLSPLRTFGPSGRQPSSPQGLSIRRLYGFRRQRRYKKWRRRRRTSPAQRYYITPEGESPQPACKAKPITGRTLAAQGRKARRLAHPSRP